MEDGASERIFLYGTLRRGASRDATVHYGGVTFLAAARTEGVLYDFGEYPGFRPRRGGRWVKGEIFEVTPPALRQLDAWEGIPFGETRGVEYRRVRMPVERADGSVESCWIYEVSESLCEGLPLVESGDWLSRTA